MRTVKMPQQQLPPPPPPSPIGPPPPAVMPVPPQPMNQPLNPATLPTSPINWQALAEQALGNHGMRTGKNGKVEAKPTKEIPLNVITIAQTLYNPSVLNLPPVKAITNQALQQGVAPVMSTSGPWGRPPGK